MEQFLKDYLLRFNINYNELKHPPVFTVEEADILIKLSPQVTHTKNLFLKDESNKFFFICLEAHKKLDLKRMLQLLNAKKKLTFSSTFELKEKLNLAPGSVSIFGLIYSNDVTLILDKLLWEAELIGFHPNINKSTLILTHENLRKYYNSLKNKKSIMSLPYLK